MRSDALRSFTAFAAGAVLMTAVQPFGHTATAGAGAANGKAGASTMAMQFAGQGRLEEHPPGKVDGARFEGRFVIFDMTGDAGPVFGEDVSLFDPKCVEKFGRGPQCAHFVAVRSGFILEGFDTGDKTMLGHTIARTSSKSRMRIYYDPQPDGSRNYDDRASFMRGELVGTYRSEEFAAIDARSGTFSTRVNYTLLDSHPFTFMGRTVDLVELAPRMSELDTGHNPEPSLHHEPIPNEEPFSNKGPGEFAAHFPVGGMLLSAD